MNDVEKAKQLFIDGLNDIENKQFKQAEKKFLKSLQLVPNRESVLNNLSSVQMRLNKYEDAKKSVLQVVKLNPKNAVGWMNLALCEQALNNY